MHYGKLTPAKIERYRVTGKPGSVKGDGDRLWIQLSKSRTLSWVFRWTEPRVVEGVRGKPRNLGLGAYPNVTNLEDARNERYRLNQLLKRGLDPTTERDGVRVDQAHARGLAKTVDQVVDEFLDQMVDVAGNSRHTKYNARSFFKKVRSTIGPLPIAKIDTNMILKKVNIEEMWTEKHRTATVVISYLERLFNFAKSRGYYKGQNPAQVKGHLDQSLPASRKVHKVTRRKSLEHRQIGQFMKELRAYRPTHPGVTAWWQPTVPLALELIVLTGARASEVTKATWNDFDRTNLVWTCPPEKHKLGFLDLPILRPITEPMLAILEKIEQIVPDHEPNAFVFFGREWGRKGPTISDVSINRFIKHTFGHFRDPLGRKLDAHGFRSTLADWCGAQPNPEWSLLVELQLGHYGDNVKRAYHRDAKMEKREPMMKEWAKYCSRIAPEPSTGSNVEDMAKHRRKTA